MTSKFYIAFFLSLAISDITAAPFLVAAIDISIASEKKENSSNSEVKKPQSTKTEVPVSPYYNKHKIINPEKNEK
jgi:hypothetical protein